MTFCRNPSVASRSVLGTVLELCRALNYSLRELMLCKQGAGFII